MSCGEEEHGFRAAVLRQASQQLYGLAHRAVEVGAVGRVAEAAVRVAMSVHHVAQHTEVVGKNVEEGLYHRGGVHAAVELGHHHLVVGLQLAVGEEHGEDVLDELMLSGTDVLAFADLHEVFPEDDDVLARVALLALQRLHDESLVQAVLLQVAHVAHHQGLGSVIVPHEGHCGELVGVEGLLHVALVLSQGGEAQQAQQGKNESLFHGSHYKEVRNLKTVLPTWMRSLSLRVTAFTPVS